MGTMMTRPWTFVDLFAGLGGFHQAARRLGGICVFASELNTELREVYASNFSLKPQGDIRTVSVELIPEHDVLFAGFPCQPFSKAGKQLGWKDAVRGTLFAEIIEIVRAKKPKLVMLENVAHFVRHDSGNTYKKVREALEELGYAVFIEEFSPHEFGVPHIRQRFYLVATRNALIEFNWPNPTNLMKLDISSVLDDDPHDAIKLPPKIEQCLDVWQEFLDILPTGCKLPSFPVWAMEFGASYPYKSNNLSKQSSLSLGRYAGRFGVSLHGLTKREQLALLPAYAQGRHLVFPGWKKRFIRQNREFFREHEAGLTRWKEKLHGFPASWQKLEWNCQGEARVLRNYVLQFRASGVRVKRRTTSPSLVAMTSTQVPIIAWEGRYMTRRECARLQSMGSLRYLPKGEAAFAALGNAVNVTVVTQILQSALGQTELMDVSSARLSGLLPSPETLPLIDRFPMTNVSGSAPSFNGT